MFRTIFLDIKIQGGKCLLRLPVPSMLKITETKNNHFFFFTLVFMLFFPYIAIKVKLFITYKRKSTSI